MKKQYCIIIIILLNILISNFVFANEKINTNKKVEIEEGLYEIYTLVNDTKVIDIDSASKNNKANVQIFERDNVQQQKFNVILNQDGTYTFVSSHSNKALDVQCGGKTPGTNVWQYEKNNSNAQKWILKSCGDGYYNIISKLNGLYLDIQAGIGNNKQNIQVYTGNGTKAQKFKFLKVEEKKANKTLNNGVYNIYSKITSNRVLEIPNSDTSNEKIVKTAIPNYKLSQKFSLYYNNDGTYTITAIHSNKVLDVKGGFGKNGTKVQQYSSNGTNAQKWIITQNKDNTYSIMSKANGLYLDIVAGSKNIGTELQTYHYNGSNAQKFIFEPYKEEKGTKSIEDGTYRIFNESNNNKIIEIENGSTKNGAKIQMVNNTNSIQQKFIIEYISDGYYKIKSKKTNKVLTVESSNPKVGSQITQQEDKNLDTQKWILKKYTDSTYNIISKCGGLYIDLNTNNKQNLQITYNTNSATQRFILVNEVPKDNIKQIQEGIYQIETTSKKVLDISCGSYNDTANVQIWNNDKVQQQKFRIEKVKNTNYYKIISINSAKVLDVQCGNSNFGANINQYSSNGTDNQYWYFKDCGNGYYNIISKSNGLVLDIASGKVNNNGANVQLYYSNGTKAQKFKLLPINIIENATYEIETKLNSNKVLDVAAASKEEGGNIQIWTADNVNQQRFSFEAISPDTYKIISKNSNKALTVNQESKNVYQSNYNNTDNQKWIIKECGDGYYNIVSKANGLVINILNKTDKNGQNVQVSNFENSNAQKFRFITGFRKFFEEGKYGKSGLAVKGDSRGSYLKYYKYGKGPKVLFTTFSIHGFEDSYNNDGAELTYIANEFKKYLSENIPESIVNEWTIYIFPNLNPDGQKYGWTNNGPGRTTLYSAAPGNKGIDMNRNWSASGESYITYKDNRNYNGTSGFQAYEARYLRDFLLKHQGNKNILIDTHGWLNETVGDYGLGAYYRKQFGISNNNHIYSYGRGYLNNWARMSLYNSRSVLVELPEVYNHSQTLSWNFAQKYINATMQLLREN